MEPDDLYRLLAQESPNEPLLGGALITLVEPHPGRRADYHRWYEDDHFYVGGMSGPFAIAGRRFVSSTALDRLSSEAGRSSQFDRGSYLSVFGILGGHVGDYQRWATEKTTRVLDPLGRGFQARDHIYTAFHDTVSEHVYDPPPMRAIHALDHEYRGLVLEVLSEAADGPEALDESVQVLFALHEGDASVGQAMAFRPRHLVPADPNQSAFDTRRLTVLWFLHEEPEANWPSRFAEHREAIGQSGTRIDVIAPFAPTVPGA